MQSERKNWHWQSSRKGLKIKGRREGTQPFIAEVAYRIGRQCPIGREFDLVIGLTSLWPHMPAEESFEYLLQGLAARLEGEHG